MPRRLEPAPLEAADPARVRRVAAALAGGLAHLRDLTRAVSLWTSHCRFGTSSCASRCSPAYSTAFAPFPKGFGTLDEIFEILTLAQTGEATWVPVMPAGTRHWSGLLGWIGDELAATGVITRYDAARTRLTDDPDQVVAWKERAWREQPRSPAATMPD